MKLRIRTADRRIQILSKRVLISQRGRFTQFFRQQIHQVLHQVSLPHQQVLLQIHTMLLKMILLLEDKQQLSVCLFACLRDPLLQAHYIQALRLKRLLLQLEGPALQLTTLADEVDSFPCLQDLLGELVREKRRDHYVVQPVLLCPQTIITYLLVLFNEKFLVGIVDLPIKHPVLYHLQDGACDFFYDSRDELPGLRTSSQIE